jgi:peptidoglycan/xylan/chitin deacetylase (PgdA/CDA1 family)
MGDREQGAQVQAENGDGPSAGLRPRLARALHRVGAMPLAGRLRGALRSDVRILAYHRVLETAVPADFRFDPDLVSASAEGFREQLRIVRMRFSPMRFDELLDRLERGRPLPRRAVLITFDDGYDDNHRIAYPLLREAGLSAMFFVSTGHIDSGRPYAYDWLVHMLCSAEDAYLHAPELGLDLRLPSTLAARRALSAHVLDRLKLLSADAQQALVDRLQAAWSMPDTAGHADCRPMTWAQLREMHAGGMEIGSHGVRHHMLAKMPRDAMRAELETSREAIAREIGVAPVAVSYPVGGVDAYDDAVLDAARAAGYAVGCSYLAGAQSMRCGTRHDWRRIPVERAMDVAWFEGVLSLPEVFCYRTRSRTG